MMIWFDTEWAGHHPGYTAALARFLLQRKMTDRVLFAVPNELKIRALTILESISSDVRDKLHFHLLDNATVARIHGVRGFVLPHLLRWRLAFDLARETAADHVFFSVLDDVLIAAALMPSPAVAYSGLIFRASLHFPELSRGWKGRIRWHLKARTLKRTLARHRFVRLFSLDPYFVEYAKRHLRHADKVVFLSEPRELFTRQREAQHVDSGGPVRFLFYGAMQARKGVRPLLEALRLLPDDVRARAEFRLCGEGDMAPFIETAVADLRASGVNVTFDPRFLPQAELDMEITTADVILMPYLDHLGSSGVLLEAAAHGKPVLTQASGMVGRDVRRFRLGEAVNTHDPAAIADAIGRIVSRIEKGECVDADFPGLLKRYDRDAFARSILELA